MLNENTYKAFVSGCFIPEPDAKYNMMRAGLELAEELMELMELEASNEYPSRGEELSELSDICFWLTFLSIQLDFELNCVDYGTVQEAYFMAPAHYGAKLIGSIKRYYRDNNLAKLDAIPSLVKNLLGSLCLEYDVTFAELSQINYAKLKARLNSNNIQGEGNR